MPPPDHDRRRVTAQRMIHDIGNYYITGDKLYDVLSTQPILAPGTVYTVIMEPATGQYKQVVRKPPHMQRLGSELQAITPVTGVVQVYE